MFDKLHSYLKYFIFFTAISLLFALPVFADSTKKRTRNTSQNQNQNSEVKLTTFDATVAYNIWNEYCLAQEQGINFPLPVFKPNADPETLKQLMAMWNEGKQKAYKESVRRFQKKSKANQLPQETSSNQNSNTKALTKFDVNVAYKIWNDYYLTQEKGINPYPPKFEPLNTNEQEAKKLIAIWNKGKQKAEKETLKRREDARTSKTSFQPQPVIPLPGSNQIPVSQTNNPYLNTPNHLKHFSKPTTIAGVFSQTTNSAYTDSVKLLNNSNSIALNNNKALAELNTKNISYNIAKAKELANIAYPLVDNPGVTTEYLIDPNNITGLPQVVEELQNGQVVRQYTYGADGIISMRQRINNEWVVSFFIKDGHGSVRMLTDVNGNVTDTYDYDAFGNLVAKTGNTPNSRLYAGEEFDEDLGFYYLRARFLDTVKGRFHTQDTFEGINDEPLSLNAYIYANSDPINNQDPFGNTAISTISSTSIAQQIISTSPTIQTSYFTAGSTYTSGKSTYTFRAARCDNQLAGIFGAPGAIAAANGFDADGKVSGHLNPNDIYGKFMHIYASRELKGITSVFIPENGTLTAKLSDNTDTYQFHYSNLQGKKSVKINASHIQEFPIEKRVKALQTAMRRRNSRANIDLKIKVEQISSLRNAAGSIFIGFIGGRGGEANLDGIGTHSHFVIGHNIPYLLSSYKGDLSFPQVFCRTLLPSLVNSNTEVQKK